jgi:hypothetical protein
LHHTLYLLQVMVGGSFRALDSQPLEKKAESVVPICISKERRLIFVDIWQ